jgi:uncharacterized repeat protein (TIGR02059 family)
VKKFLFFLLLSVSLTLNATTYYVAPNGNDSNPGTITQPWASWQKGFSSIVAGDILYIRGGTYTKMADSGRGVSISGRDGRNGSVITVSAYPGETPVLDCSSLSASSGVNYGVNMSGCDYWQIKGLTIKNVREYNNLHKSVSGSSPVSGWELSNCSNVTLELCIVTGCGNGFTLNGTLYDINYLNCDSYLNYDYYDNGGLANGFNGHIEGSSTVNYTGCRAWSNSDDGFDNYAGAGYIIYKNCWSYRNGKDTPTKGNGDGFKLGFDHTPVELPNNQRTLTNCIAADNSLMGFDEGMDQPTGMDMALFNCIAYKNSNDFGFRFSRSWGTAVTTLRNNVAYGNMTNYEGRSRNIADHNSWNIGATISDADFVSTDMSQIKNPRKGDGSLPDIDFTKLKSGSRLIDAGIDVGLPYSGTAPDIGPFETGNVVSTTPPVSGPAPVYQSSEIKSSDPSSLVIQYNLSFAAITPDVSSFEVKVNSVVRSIKSLTVSGSTVSAALSTPVIYGDIVTFSYTMPSSNPLQSSNGTKAESISGITVVNSVAAPAPVYIGAVVQNDSPDKVEMSYDSKLANILPPASSFITTVNGEKKVVVGITVSDNTVTLTLPENLSNKDSITVTYIQPDKNPLQSTKGGIAVTLTEKPVKNEIQGVATNTAEINGGKTLIFPNPARDYIKIANFIPDNNVPVLRIFDISGKLCQEIKLEDVTKMRKIPIELKSGFYIAQILSGKEVKYVQKIVVVK